jgi:hypothetical protein
MDGARTLSLNFGTPEAEPFLLSGWSKPEGSRGATFQWSSDTSSRMGLYFERAPDTGMWVAASVVRPAELEQQTITTIINGRPVDTAPLRAGEQWFRAVVPADALRAGANVFEFGYSSVVRPLQHHVGSTDVRRLGVLWKVAQFGFLSSGHVAGVGTRSSGVVLGKGWSDPEPWGAGAAVWGVGSGSTFDICLAPVAGDYLLVLNAKTELGPMSVPVFADTAQLGSLELDEQMAPHLVHVPANRVHWGHNVLEARYPRPFQPAALTPGSEDRRLLAMLVTSAALVPEKSAATAEVTTPLDQRQFSAGWGPVEQQMPGASARVDALKAVVEFDLQPLETSYRVIVEGESTGPKHEDVRVRVNSQLIGYLGFESDKWHASSVHVPAHVVSAGKNTVELSYAGPVLDDSKGNPLLSLRVRRVTLVPDAAK